MIVMQKNWVSQAVNACRNQTIQKNKVKTSKPPHDPNKQVFEHVGGANDGER